MKNLIFILSLIIIVGCNSDSNKETKNSNTKTDEKVEGDTAILESKNLNSLPDGEYFFSGAIARIYPFHMRFEVINNKISGAYYYHSQKKELQLSGNIIEGKLELDESYKDKVTGHFASSVFTLDSISGNWKSPKGTEFDFVLSPSNSDDYLNNLSQQKMSWTTEEFLAFANKFETVNLPFNYEPVSGESDKTLMNTNHVSKFIYPNYNPEDDFHYHFYYGKKYETENYIALIYTEVYFPGAFGIDNSNMVMRTYSKKGEPIDDDYLGCHCLDNNYYDYYTTTEHFKFTIDKIIITGTFNSASHDWAEEEGMPVFDETKEINRTIKLSNVGMIGN